MLSEAQIEAEELKRNELIQKSDWLLAFKQSEHWAHFKTLILDVMDKECYQGYKGCDPSTLEGQEAIRQFQAMGNVVENIQKRLDILINAGVNARNQIALSKEDE